MRARSLAALLVLLALGTVAHAQVGVYGKFDYVHFNDGTSGNGFTGGGVGIYDDFTGLGPVRLGLDLRGDLVTQSKFNYRTLLGGVRLMVKVPLVGLRPYVEAAIGVGGTEAKGPFAAGITSVSYNNKLTYEGIAGLDARVFPHIDWRVLELAGGSQSKLDANQPTLFSVSTGLVVRF